MEGPGAKESVRFSRITVRADQMGGVPCIRGLRIPVATVVGMPTRGMTREEVVNALPDLGQDDIDEAMKFAARAARERRLRLTIPAPWLGKRARRGRTSRSSCLKCRMFLPKSVTDSSLHATPQPIDVCAF
jgi:uncharacterized protein (DUF433 family)